MNILSRFTLKDLKLNKKRSIVTIIAIILSTALICAVSCMFFSFWNVIKEDIKYMDGNQHVVFFNVDTTKLSEIKANRKVKDTFAFKKIGLDANEDYGYVNFYEYDQNTFENFNVKLVEGRLPENSNEVIVYEYLDNVYNHKFEIGNYYTFEIETGIDAVITKEYKVVGIYENSSYVYSYAAITLNNNITNPDVGVIYKNIKDTYKESKNIAGSELDYEVNKDYLRYSGVAASDKTQRELYTLLGIVIGIIVVCSVFVIRNSFAISITEKKKELAMLISVGSTKRQIKNIVIKEGLFLSIIGIPLGILLGIFASLCLVVFTKTYLGAALNTDIMFDLVIPPITIILTIIGALVTVLLSCLVSAHKASRISPIDTIRNSDDFKIKNKKIRSNKLIKKLFGIGGDIANKNLKRSRKRYRTTVISLVVSITIFIALSSFIGSGFRLINSELKVADYNIYVSSYDETPYKSHESVKKYINSEYVVNYSLERSLTSYNTNLTDELLKHNLNLSGDTETYVEIISVGEKSYNDFLKEINLSYEEAKDKLILLTSTDIKLNKLIFDDNEYEVIKKTNKLPFGYKVFEGNKYLFFIASDSYMDTLDYSNSGNLYIYTDNNIEYTKFANSIENDNVYISDLKEEMDSLNRIIIWISVFLYGFIIVITLIGVTNVFNTITTNMNLRSKEFAILKSVGMTKKEFNRMIRLESIMYGSKSLIIGSLLGTGLSYLIYNFMDIGSTKLPYQFPIGPILICVVFVSIVVTLTMRFSMHKINKQNIIETIRKDNI